jgi:hypothetical protein
MEKCRKLSHRNNLSSRNNKKVQKNGNNGDMQVSRISSRVVAKDK